MILVAGSMIGVPVIPTVFGMSPQFESEDWKGGSRVRELIMLPVRPSRILMMF